MSRILSLPYIDIQHDALAVIDDVEQGVVPSEDFWVSGYRTGESSVHGKVRVERRGQVDEPSVESAAGDGDVWRKSTLKARDGVQVLREGSSTFRISVPALKLRDVPLRFPRQTLAPVYEKKSAVSPALTINAIAFSQRQNKLVVGGPDGYLRVLDSRHAAAAGAGAGAATGAQAESGDKDGGILLKGHVGDILDVKFFPSGEVILSTSSDLSIRIFSLAGLNPRTLTGHSRGVTSTAIRGVGREIVSGSKDGTVRLWHVGKGKETRRWYTQPAREVVAVLIDDGAALNPSPASGEAGGTGDGAAGVEEVLAVRADGVVQVWPLDAPAELGRTELDGKEAKREGKTVVSAAWDHGRRVLALGYTDGVVRLIHRPVRSDAGPPATPPSAMADTDDHATTTSPASDVPGPAYVDVRRNESAVYSLFFTPGGDLCVGTAAGLPCRLEVRYDSGHACTVADEVRLDGQGQGQQGGSRWEVRVLEEYAGWDATGVMAWCAVAGRIEDEGSSGGQEPGTRVRREGVWCAGAEAVVRRY